MQLAALFRIELLKSYHWIKTNAAAKLIVIIGFLIVISALLFGEFIASYYYFQFLSQQEEFGLPIMQYTLNAAVLFIFILAVCSSIGTTYVTLYRSSYIAHLFTMPVPISRIILQNYITTSIPSLIISLLLLPLFISSGLHYGANWGFIIRIVFVLCTLSITAHAIGNILTHVITYTLGNRSRPLMRFAWILIIFGLILTVQIIFPSSFRKLYFAPDLEAFQAQYYDLPLVSVFIPTNWWAYTITIGPSVLLIPIIATTLAMLALSLYIGRNLVVNSWRNHAQNLISSSRQTHLSKHTKNFPLLSSNPRIQLLINEFLSILRSPSDINYIAFLVGMIVTLLALIQSLPLLRTINPDFLPYLVAISWASLTHIFLLLAARIYYPSISRIKKILWFQFSLPVTRNHQLIAKITQVKLISLLALPIGLLTAALLKVNPWPFAITMWITVTNIGLTQLFWGVVSPNFNESDNPEAASTSGSGVLALLHSIYLLTVGAYIIYLWNSNYLTSLEAILYPIIIHWLSLIPLYLWARHNIYTYKL